MNATEIFPEIVGLCPSPVFSYTFLITMGLATVTVFSNAVTLAAFFRQKRLWTYTNYYVFNMTLADMVVGVIVMPVRSTIILCDAWIFGSAAGMAYLVMQNWCLGVSVMGVVVITIDRYLATFHPIRHYMGRNKRIATIVNAITWVIPFIYWMTLNVFWPLIDPQNLQSATGLPRPNFTESFWETVTVNVIVFAIPFLMISILYLRIYCRIRSTGRDRKAMAAAVDTSQQSQSRSKDVGIHLSETESQIAIDSTDQSCVSTSIASEVANEIQCISKMAAQQVTAGQANTLQHQNQSIVIHLNNMKDNPEYPHLKDTVSKGNSQNNFETRSQTLNKKIRHAKQKNSDAKQASSSSSSQGRKAMRTLTLIILTFALTWSPSILSVSLFSFSRKLYGKLKRAIGFTELARWISFANSMLNPMAYAMAQPLIRQTIADMFCRRR